MVVCKCRKATKIYCFVHKVPVCGECICSPEHQICVVRTYSEWVIDGEYDWPSTCCLCNAALHDGVQTTRLGCLDLIHTSCLLSHIQSVPSQTAPSGYVCPLCSSPIWPPKSIKDTGSRLHSKLKEAIIQSGLEKNMFGNHLVSIPPAESRPPPAFASDPLARLSAANSDNGANSYDSSRDPSLSSTTTPFKKMYSTEAYPSLSALGSSTVSEPDIIEVECPSPLGNQLVAENDPNFLKSLSPGGPGATTRKGAYTLVRQNSEIQYYADDEDGGRKKYDRRGPFRHKFLRLLLPFWSNALPILPVTAPPRKDGTVVDDIPEGRMRHQKSSRMDPRKILLTMAIMACMATMGILYYRLAQRSLGDDILEDEPQ